MQMDYLANTNANTSVKEQDLAACLAASTGMCKLYEVICLSFYIKKFNVR